MPGSTSKWEKEEKRGEKRKFVRNDQARQEARPPILPLREEGSLVEWEGWEGRAKLQRTRRWIFDLGEIPLVIVSWVGLVAKSAKVEQPNLLVENP